MTGRIGKMKRRLSGPEGKAARQRAAAVRFERNREPKTGNTPLGTTEAGRSLMRVNRAKKPVPGNVRSEPSKEPEFKIEGMFA